ncbi:unnamed protein product [Fusarium graminearum]|uniref:Uncharacterized protein n=1 Tax=Gibberella zeae TaxID=5518 RepID=A0A4E9EM57_GIBZA|nr:unnamed protein product [Fusarium graminearum]CAF3587329.1 unnamed protein product [Fusarium graminearum]CAF3631488.1 unnamed protein product [Fusarium graminearum]CAG1975083.1 unnamed protein product [Fusarium graminearum]CAG1981806.1 unnamed protein product [Fusarium graminearum]
MCPRMYLIFAVSQICKPHLVWWLPNALLLSSRYSRKESWRVFFVMYWPQGHGLSSMARSIMYGFGTAQVTTLSY